MEYLSEIIAFLSAFRATSIRIRIETVSESDDELEDEHLSEQLPLELGLKHAGFLLFAVSV